MPYSQEKAKEIFEYVEKFGKEEAIKHFNISWDSIRRAKRRYKENTNEQPTSSFNITSALKRIQETYSEKRDTSNFNGRSYLTRTRQGSNYFI